MDAFHITVARLLGLTNTDLICNIADYIYIIMYMHVNVSQITT